MKTSRFARLLWTYVPHVHVLDGYWYRSLPGYGICRYCGRAVQDEAWSARSRHPVYTGREVN